MLEIEEENVNSNDQLPMFFLAWELSEPISHKDAR